MKNQLVASEAFTKFMKKKKEKSAKQHIAYVVDDENEHSLLIRSERKDVKSNLIFTTNFFLCEIDHYGKYSEKFINPAFGIYNWKLESYGRIYLQHKITTICSSLILENYFNLYMFHEIMDYLIAHFPDTTEVHIHTYLHVDNFQISETEYNNFIGPKGYYSAEKNITIILN